MIKYIDEANYPSFNMYDPGQEQDLVFSNGCLDYIPFFIAHALARIRTEDKKFFIIPNEGRNVGKLKMNPLLFNFFRTGYLRNYVHAYGSSSYLQSTTFFSNYYDRLRGVNNIMFTLVCPAAYLPEVPDYTYDAIDLREASPFLCFKHFTKNEAGRYYMSVGYRHNWREVDTSRMEFWISELYYPGNKQLVSSNHRGNRKVADELKNYMYNCGVKTVYKSQDEMDNLQYRPKLESYSVEQLIQWKKTMGMHVVQSFVNH